MLHTISKASQILHLFSLSENEWGVRGVARALEMPKSTTGELMESLAEQGLLVRTRSGRYRLGWRLFELSQVLLGTSEFYAEARPVMQELVARWREITHLAVLDGVEVVYVEKVQPPMAMPISLSWVGARLPAHSSGVGKVLLAHQEWRDVLKPVEQKGLGAHTPNTITTLDALAHELAQVRRQGYAYDQEETMLGLGCVAAPIRNLDGLVVAAISFSVPARRFYPQQENYTAIITKAAQGISHTLGYREKPRQTSGVQLPPLQSKAQALPGHARMRAQPPMTKHLVTP
jgi:IclR family KDG regulon transcriptional repressor